MFTQLKQTSKQCSNETTRELLLTQLKQTSKQCPNETIECIVYSTQTNKQMIAYEIQLQYVIQDKTSPRQNPVQDKIQEKKIPTNFFPTKNFFHFNFFFFSKKIWQFCLKIFFTKLFYQFFFFFCDKKIFPKENFSPQK